MEKSFHRKPIGNFFILKDLQLRLIRKIVIAVLISTVVCVVSLLLVYFLRYQSVLFYQLTMEQELTKENILGILIPGLGISAIVNIIVGFFVGLYASRKYAVPIYKLEEWAKLLRQGYFNAHLMFRERDEMRELTTHCNLLAGRLREQFQTIKRHAETAAGRHHEDEDLQAIINDIAALQIDTDSIKVNTGFFKVPSETGKTPPESDS